MLTPIAAPSAKPVAKPLNKEERLKSEILNALARLDGGAGFKISRGRLRDDLIASGAIEINSRGHMTLSARHIFSRAMLALSRKHGEIAERDGVVWRVGAVAERRRAVADAIDDGHRAESTLAASISCQSGPRVTFELCVSLPTADRSRADLYPPCLSRRSTLRFVHEGA